VWKKGKQGRFKGGIGSIRNEPFQNHSMADVNAIKCAYGYCRIMLFIVI
jgi:hypothetical protein